MNFHHKTRRHKEGKNWENPSCLGVFVVNPLRFLWKRNPDLPTQRRIAALLKEQMAGVEAARKAVEEQMEAIAALPATYLREVFGVRER